MDLKNFLKLIALIFLCQLAGIIGSFFTISAIPEWYAFLIKPFFSPPNYLFAPVWILLYALMGISIYLILKNGFNSQNKKAVIFFSIQLILNTLWSIIFFGLKNPLLAFIEIIFLWIFIALTINEFFKISKKAGYLLIPYILWVSFASILNLFIFLLN
jgi:translocator protein